MSNYLGIEFGSTRIKAVVIDDNFTPRSTGDYVWKSDFSDGVWTYSLDEAFEGLRKALSETDTSGVAAMGNLIRNGISLCHSVHGRIR